MPAPNRPASEWSEVKELRLRVSAGEVVDLIRLIDAMDMGPLHTSVAAFLMVASDIANWHPVEEA